MTNTQAGGNYQHFDQLLGSEETPFVRQYADRLSDQREQTAHFQEVELIDNDIAALSQPMRELPTDSKEYEQTLEEYLTLTKRKQALGHTALLPVSKLQQDIRSFTDNQTIHLESSDPLVQEITQHLFTGIDLQPNADAPFAEYANNTESKWQYIADVAIRSYLLSKPFTSNTPNQSDFSGYSLSISMSRSSDHVINIPSESFVNAAGFSSWLGRGYGGSGEKHPNTPIARHLDKNERFTSLNTIKNYAATPSELPSVRSVNTYIQPNGNIFSDNESGDSHRVAAAILRGDSHIKADHLSVHLLNSNWFDNKLS